MIQICTHEYLNQKGYNCQIFAYLTGVLYNERKETQEADVLELKGREIGAGKPCICVPVMEKEKEAVIEEIKCLSESTADMIEWRVDAFENIADYNAIRDILETIRPYLKEKIFLYTFRSKKQGGCAEVDEDTLNDLHDLAAESGCVDLIDLEYFEEDRPAHKIYELHQKGVKVVASHHDFEETPDFGVMKMLLEKMCVGDADIVKLAVMPQKKQDVLKLLAVTSEFCRENPKIPVITMSMGEMGVISRLSGESFGSCVTFAAHKKASAPGQMSLADVSTILEMIHKSITNQ